MCGPPRRRGWRRTQPRERELTMKAIRAREGTGISGLVLEEVPDPHPNFCEVVVKVAACGITHNELRWTFWTCRAGNQRTTIIPGHEVSGVVVGLGFGTAGLAVGDEVFGLTDQLRDGAAAEYVAIEARNLASRSEEHTSELQSRRDLVCRLLLEKKKYHAVMPARGRAGACSWRAVCGLGGRIVAA